MSNRINTISPYTRAIMKGHLCSCGVKYSQMDKPIIAIANSWNELVPGHIHLRELSEKVKEGIEAAGGIALEFNTIAVCDGIAQGHDGMRYSLPSRELVADSVEVMVNSHGMFDGLVVISSCDKTVPGMLMAAARLNIPSIAVLGGVMPNHIKPYESKAARRSFLDGTMDEEELVAITKQYYPGPGACSFLGTANTMQGLTEALGMALPYTSWMQANSVEQLEAAKQAGLRVMELVKENIRPEHILTRQAFENAITVLLAMGGSLNACLHLPAIANELQVPLPLELFDELSEKTPFIARVVPNNQLYTTNDLQRAGGVPAIMQELNEYLHTDIVTVTGHTVGANIATARILDHTIIRSVDEPFHPDGGIVVLKGNLATAGALIKQSAVPEALRQFTGVARTFNAEEQFEQAYEAGDIREGDVIVIRYEGPRSGPGMRELHRCTEILSKFEKIALITDGRFSGASSGLSIGYVSPEAAANGTIALVEDGDLIDINLNSKTLSLLVDDIVLQQRATQRQELEVVASKFLRLYARSSASAALGAIRVLE